MVEFRVISIGALAAHPLRNEGSPVRLGHGTTTLLDDGAKFRLLVDPALPGEILKARLKERAGLEVSDLTHVFLTSFRPDLRQGLGLFENAVWWISEREREAVGVALVEDFKRLTAAGASGGGGGDDINDETVELLKREIAILQKTAAAPDRMCSAVDLFPLPGRTPGLCGLIVSNVNATVLICGDAIATAEHLESGKVLPDCFDIEQAQESFREAVEIADVLVLGRDNVVMNSMRRVF